MSESDPTGTDRTALHVEERGAPDAPLVVLVHGSMDRGSGMNRVVKRLEDRYLVVTYDRRGYGASMGVPGPRTAEGNAQDLVDVLDGRRGLVFGHSVGGTFALAVAQRRPDLVRAVGVFEAPMYWEPWWPDDTTGRSVLGADGRGRGDAEDAAESFMRRLLGDERWERLPSSTREDRRAEGPALVAEMADLAGRAPYASDAIGVPVLVARGERSKDHHRRAAALLAERVASPRRAAPSEFVEVPGVSHGAHLQDPDAFAALVDRLAALADLADQEG
jgi:pimeloyl-ACP methyl ester carboxylesterase